ncbi:MAG: hypothetical protein AB7V45_11080 [Candidatus Krumholzibacteriia bacterium]
MDHVRARTFPRVFADRLVELDDRLHQAPLDPRNRAGVPAEFSRIELSLDLLAREFGHADPAGLAEVVAAFGRLRGTLTDVPERNPGHLAPVWTAVAGFLESLLVRLDLGEDPGSVPADPRWEELGHWLLAAGTAEEAMVEIKRAMDRWVAAWGDGELPDATEDSLAREWVRLRAYGDSLFRSDLLGGFASTPDHPGR